jgi:glycosyltransferase involved in cell wall biosynthesis
MPTLLAINNYHYYRGGAETVFLEHSKMFEAAGWTVVPFAMRHPRNLASDWSAYFVDEIEFGEGYTFGEKLRRVPKVIYSLESRRKLENLLNAARPDICHAHNIYHHISPSILGLLHQRKVPTVMTLHDLKIACPAYQMLSHGRICERCRNGRLYNVALHRCIKGSVALSVIAMVEAVVHSVIRSYSTCVQRFIVPSRFYARKLAEWGIAADRFRHVPNFVDVERYQPQFEVGDYILYFGRLSAEKGLSTLIVAAAEARVKLMIAGTGSEAEALSKLADQVGADVRLLGYLAGDALRDAVRNARAIVLPSEWYENAPMSILEAYALGKPVLGANIGGISELIRENVTGFLFASGDADSLAETLRQVDGASHASLRAMGMNGRRWVERDFTGEIYRDRIAAIYAELGVGRAESV